jgi:hypothetical protein
MPKCHLLRCAVIAAVCFAGGCSESDSSEPAEILVPPPLGLVGSEPTPAVTPEPVVAPVPQPSHRFDERRGDTYYYIAAVSEEDRKRGRAVGSVSSFQYLGKTDAGEHIVASLNSNGTVSYRAKCAVACKIIDTDYGEKIAFSPSSIIGAVFEDAFRGRLKVVQWSIDPIVQPAQDPPTVPARASLPTARGEVPIVATLPEPSPGGPTPEHNAPLPEVVEAPDAPSQ